CLSGFFSLWPRKPVELVLLSLWPSRRRLVGITLQAYANCGVERAQLLEVARTYLRRHPNANWLRNAQSIFASNIWRHQQAFQAFQNIDHLLGTGFSLDFRRDFSLFCTLKPVFSVTLAQLFINIDRNVYYGFNYDFDKEDFIIVPRYVENYVTLLRKILS